MYCKLMSLLVIYLSLVLSSDLRLTVEKKWQIPSLNLD